MFTITEMYLFILTSLVMIAQGGRCARVDHVNITDVAPPRNDFTCAGQPIQTTANREKKDFPQCKCDISDEERSLGKDSSGQYIYMKNKVWCGVGGTPVVDDYKFDVQKVLSHPRCAWMMGPSGTEIIKQGPVWYQEIHNKVALQGSPPVRWPVPYCGKKPKTKQELNMPTADVLCDYLPNLMFTAPPAKTELSFFCWGQHDGTSAGNIDTTQRTLKACFLDPAERQSLCHDSQWYMSMFDFQEYGKFEIEFKIGTQAGLTMWLKGHFGAEGLKGGEMVMEQVDRTVGVRGNQSFVTTYKVAGRVRK